MKDEYKNTPKTIDSVAEKAYAITPDDNADLPTATRSIYVGTGGDLKVDMVDSGTGVVFKNLPDGALLPIRVKKVYTTDTTALNLVALL